MAVFEMITFDFEGGKKKASKLLHWQNTCGSVSFPFSSWWLALGEVPPCEHGSGSCWPIASVRFYGIQLGLFPKENN